MHPRAAALIALCDGELNPGRSWRVARHVQQCEKCRDQLRRIEREKNLFSELAQGSGPAMDVERGLAAVLSAMAVWKEAAAPELRSRVRAAIETYLGSGAASMVERPDICADELLAKALALVTAFLGPNAADAVANDLLRGLETAQD